MEHLTRRRFLNRSMAAVAGTVLSPAFSYSGNNNYLSTPASYGQGSDKEKWDLLKAQFPLDEGLIYFNNGSLGPSPDYVIEATEEYRRMLEGFPSKYMWGGWDKEKEGVRSKIAEYFCVTPEEIAIIHNTTEGMNLFARSFDLKPGDEIILADHEHITGTTPYQYFCERRGVKIIRPVLPLNPTDPDELVEVYRRAITDRTRLISMVHMTNTNGMILPVKEVSELAHEHGILVCVDGAQTAGMLNLDLHELGCDFYAASGHKWLFGPKGAGVLYARKEMLHQLEPLMLAHQFKEKEIRMFEDYNTRNLPELLGLGSAIDYNNMIGKELKEKRIYELKHYFRERIENNPAFLFKTPVDDSLSAGIQVVEIVGKNAADAKNFLFEEFKIDCRPMDSHRLNALRISLSLFTTFEDIDTLVEGLRIFAEN